MSKIEINKEFKEYLDQLCEEHIIKITKKNETEEAFNYIKEDIIKKIIENYNFIKGKLYQKIS